MGSKFAALASSPDSGDRAWAAFTLDGRRLRPSELAALRELLFDKDALVRNFAAQSLGSATDIESMDDIIRVLRAASPSDVRGAAWALMRIGIEWPESRDVVEEELTAYRRRARGKNRLHADALLALVATHYSLTPRKADGATSPEGPAAEAVTEAAIKAEFD